MTISPAFAHNALLARLSPSVAAAIQPAFQHADLPEHHVLYAPGQAITHAYFPLAGICSVIAQATGNVRSEVGIIGREGFVGAPLVLGSQTSPQEVVMQIAGRGLRIDAHAFKATIDGNPDFLAVVLGFVHVFMVQTGQTTVANSHFYLSQRLARWLLMCQDRADTPDIELTHDFLAIMLSVRRSGVSEALADLEGRNWIHNTRGRLRIVNREALIGWAGGSYGLAEAEYEKMFPELQPSPR